MARYADIDKVMQNLNTNKYGDTNVVEVGIALDKAIADVVPRSEVEKFAEEIKLEFYREFDEIIPSIMADKIDELKKKYTEGEHDE